MTELDSLRVLVTGASGLLGRQIIEEFSSLPSFSPFGLCFSRPDPNLTRLDLTDVSATADFLNQLKPQIVIHAAAQRFPDQVEKDPEAAQELNVSVSRRLAVLCKELEARLIYISTDYVFDGTAAPYSHLAAPKPANRYGETKLAGELAVLEENSDSIILRVPVLYGPVQDLKESALTVLLDVLRNHKTPVSLSSYEVRCPAHTRDIAKILGDMAARLEGLEGGVYQWSGRERWTKWDVVRMMSRELNLPMDHVTEVTGPSGGAARPRDVEMERTRLEEKGIGCHRDFTEGFLQSVKPFL